MAWTSRQAPDPPPPQATIDAALAPGPSSDGNERDYVRLWIKPAEIQETGISTIRPGICSSRYLVEAAAPCPGGRLSGEDLDVTLSGRP